MFYFLSSLFAAIVVNLCNTGLSPSKYFRQGFWETASQGLIGNLMSYTLCRFRSILSAKDVLTSLPQSGPCCTDWYTYTKRKM